MTPFNETVTIRVEDEGEYVLLLRIGASTPRKRHAGVKDMRLPFKITE